MSRQATQAIAAVLTLAIACTLASTGAYAAWPADKPIRLIVPYAAGGATDILGRAVGNQMAKELKQTIVVENKPGAGSMLGSQQVVRSEPDGYTILLGSISNVLNMYFYKEPLYDLRKDLKPVAQIVSVPNFLAVSKSVPVKNVAELIALAKQKPGELSCATSGVGSSPYLSCELFKVMAGIELINTPFKGGAPAIQSAIGNQTTMVFANEAWPYIDSGQLRGLGVTTAERSPYSTDIPAIAETLPKYDVTAWYGFWVPAKTPDKITNAISKAATDALQNQQVLNSLKQLGATPKPSDPQQFGDYVNSEIDRWAAITKEMNVQAK
ncbi:Bug family tripartite tricarboxylate transporter substrate binding protein [Advenella mimigardefordensis]|uniref:Putative Bug-like extracytoplasmic solute binding receptor, TTT family n=1 Tax=Advenella mimigardefordensis (strain DSM 17166 / LMG 22922 / DPN7) TaxID=1247726 RepID=W0PIE0_ADVMD|nr:tripartite tricarboxylate transporter substrate binding protein [Advenella mimigardefordensis]AHG65667.1 putative Bug-like extracytoplasmic solute binding receptor, TTT family [Advenella mimigardefordensis DPN7]